MSNVPTVPTEFRYDLSEKQRKKVRFLAGQEGMTPLAFLEREAIRALKRMLNESDMLSFKDAAIELGCSCYTVARYYHEGLFPSAVHVNPRVIRIPRGDVVKFLEERRMVIGVAAR